MSSVSTNVPVRRVLIRAVAEKNRRSVVKDRSINKTTIISSQHRSVSSSISTTTLQQQNSITNNDSLLIHNEYNYRKAKIINNNISSCCLRHQSSSNGSGNEMKDEKKDKSPSLEETIKQMKGKNDNESSADENSKKLDETIRQVSSYWGKLKDEVSLTWNDLIKASDRKSINKKIHPIETKDGDKPYNGPVQIMIIDESLHLTAWQRMQKRLSDAPIIQDIMNRTEAVYHNSGAAKMKEKVDFIRDDAKEAWETSQNPWVYRISSVYDTLTAATPESIAVKELRILDSNFTLDDWREDVIEHTLPFIMKWFLEGRINQLKPWLGESVFKRLAAEMKAREQEGVQIDTRVLAIMNSEILAIEPDMDNKQGSPIIILHFMCQQINCVRKKKDNTIIEGNEDDIRANSYVVAFQREYNEEKGELNWKIVDFRFNGAIAYL